jgi:uncharacterized protein
VSDQFLSLCLTAVSWTLLSCDWLTGRMRRLLAGFPFEKNRLIIPSGDRKLSAVYVSAGENTPAVLICHGIGERVEYWARVQAMFQELGVSSLVFNYSGYGASSGSISTANCEEDATSAYAELVRRGNHPVFLLGFSLGSGVACAIASNTQVNGIILCEGYSTLREAALAFGFPGWMTRMVPNVWDTVHSIKDLQLPVLVVHSDRDELFPLPMAHGVVEACGLRGQLVLIRGVVHNGPILAPEKDYWRPVVEWMNQHLTDDPAEKLLKFGS